MSPVRSSQVVNVADDPELEPDLMVPTQLGRTGALVGATVSFGASLLYVACLLLFQLGVHTAGATSRALMPQTAEWATLLLVYLIFGTVASVVLGAAVGALNGVIQTKTWKSQSPGLAWTIGMVIGLAVALLVQLILNAEGLHHDLSEQLRFFTIPSMIFVISTALTSVLTRQRHRL
ncbi:hypothetical protein FOE78_19810 [Microlunatus elymi]|uniref:Uncharacterized protein n=1 Tax=Microlunatus elymi TaxID=2596828 RepID=A0A516Q3Q3_9ACTN|nr:hypothetical protein [Microlunatus elymi]QDP97851.1 hypothetical protein FOE78_19810 [Microlunatus elymi]